MTIGALNRAARAAAGVSIQAIAASSGIPLATVRKLEGEAAEGHGRQQDLTAWLAANGVVLDLPGSVVSMQVDPDSPSQIGRLFAAARTLAGLNQSELANSADVSVRTVNSLEAGRSAVLGTVRDALVAALRSHGVSIEPDFDRGLDRWRIVASTAQGVEAATDEIPHEPRLGGETDEQRAARRSITAELDRVGYYRVRAEIEGTEPLVWREMLLPQTTTFFDLHAVLQTAFGWRRRHQHEFRCGILIGNLAYADGSISDPRLADERMLSIHQVARGTGPFEYTYDLGDNYVHVLRILGQEKAGADPAYPTVVAGEGAPIPEDVGGEERWNELAAKLRKGKPPRDMADWLEEHGYGRNYDPDALDLDAVNAELRASRHDIPASWMADYHRQKALVVTAPHFKTEYPEPPKAPRFTSKAVRVVSVTPFKANDYRRGLANDPQGSATVPTGRDGCATVRGGVAGLVGLLAVCPDIESFEGTPVQVAWTDGAREGTFRPDFAVRSKGRPAYLHFAFDEEEYEFCTRLRAAGFDMSVVGAAILDHPAVATVREMRRWRDLAGVPGKSMLAILEAAGGAKGVPMQEATRILLAEGYGHQEGVVGGNPAGRTESRIAGAVMRGEIGIDLSKPMATTRVGPLALTERTGKFWRIAKDYEL